MKHLLKLAAIAAMLGFFACSPAAKGKSAGKEYCKCSKKDGIAETVKCQKEMMKKYKEDLTNLEFQEAFWKAVGDCD